MSAYEFTHEQNQAFGGLSQKMRIAIILLVITGIVQLGWAVQLFRDGLLWPTVLQATAAALYLGMAYLFNRPLDNFKRISTTTGGDIRELMIAVNDLHQAFNIAVILIIIRVIGYFAVAFQFIPALMQ